MLVAQETIEKKIYLVRGHKVMLDNDLAELYGVKTKSLNLAVKRNISRFPTDFMFQLSGQEYESLRFQIETLKLGRGRHRKYLPFVFTEQGVAMLSSVLNSERAIQVNIQIMRIFTKLKQIMFSSKELALKLQILERKFTDHDKKFEIVFEAIRKLIQMPKEETRKIGFKS